MPWAGSAGSQTFSRTDGTRTGATTWTQAAAAPVNILATDHDTHDQDVADGVNACFKKDGGNTATADLPMGGFKLSNVGVAAARTQYARFSQVQDNAAQYIATVGGTADVITLTPAIAITAYAAGQRFTFIASGNNTTAVTVNVSAVGAKAVVLPDGVNTALSGAEILGGSLVDIEYDGTQFQLLTWRPAVEENPTYTNVTATKVQSTTIELGHASDTTLSRVSAGLIAVEGSNLLRASDVVNDDTTGGTAVPASAEIVKTLGAEIDAITVPAAADATEQEAGTEAAKYVAPLTQQRHPSAVKCWVRFNAAATVAASYNITSITDVGVGNWTVNIGTDFSSVNYCGVVSGGSSNVPLGRLYQVVGTPAAGTFDVQAWADFAGTLGDPNSPDAIFAAFFGDQA